MYSIRNYIFGVTELYLKIERRILFFYVKKSMKISLVKNFVLKVVARKNKIWYSKNKENMLIYL